MNEINAVLTIAYRDVMKFLRDKPRIVATFIFPFIFIGVLGGSLQANLGEEAGYNFLTFAFTGVIGQTLFQSVAAGIISLIEDKENDFSREIFVAPISRYTIILGKILGESLVASLQVFGIILFGVVMGIQFSFGQIVNILPAWLLVCLLGGGFGVVVMSSLSSQRSANQIFPFLIFPQFFLAGVFTPIKNLPWYLLALSRIAPMTYAVDLIRWMFYGGTAEFSKVVLFPLWVDVGMALGLSFVFITTGTYLFVRNERNK
jgi:ABC-2 type transport system permease protein